MNLTGLFLAGNLYENLIKCYQIEFFTEVKILYLTNIIIINRVLE